MSTMTDYRLNNLSCCISILHATNDALDFVYHRAKDFVSANWKHFVIQKLVWVWYGSGLQKWVWFKNSYVEPHIIIENIFLPTLQVLPVNKTIHKSQYCNLI
jgi:hypothetical protein